jgi:hypothetical protein
MFRYFLMTSKCKYDETRFGKDTKHMAETTVEVSQNFLGK